MAADTGKAAELPTTVGDAVARETSMRKSLLVCAFYGCTSVSITFFNKAVFSVYKFHFPCLLTLMQIFFCIFALCSAHLMNFITLPSLEVSMMKQVFPLSFCWWLYVVTGIVGLRYLNIPMFSTLRKFTVLLVLLGEMFVLGKTAKPGIWFSVGIMLTGGLVAGVTDLTFSLPGYVFVGICCVATALYLVLIVRIGKTTKLDSFSLLFYNNVVSLFLMVPYLFLFTSEWYDVQFYPYIDQVSFWMFLILSAAQATLLNIAIFFCTKLNSPIATSVTGQVKDIFTVSVGLFVFGDVKISAPNLMGLGLAMLGSLFYSIVKFQSSRQRE